MAPDLSTGNGPAAIQASSARSPTATDNDTKLVSLLYGTIGTPDGWETFLNELSRTYRGGRGSLLFHDTEVRNGFAVAVAAGDPAIVNAYNRHYVSVNPWLPHVGRRPLGVVLSSEPLMPRADLLKTEFYADWLRPAQFESSVGVTIQKDGSRHLIVSMLLPPGAEGRDFDTIGRLQRLVPHMLRTAQLNRRFAELETRAVAAESALEGMATAMLIVNGTGQIVYMNAAAGRIVAAGDGVKIVHGALEPIGPRDGDVLQRLLASAHRAVSDVTILPGGVMRINRKSGLRSYEVLVAPLSGVTVALDIGGPLAVVFIRDPEARDVQPLDRLRHLYGLTGAEARVMQSLVGGDTLDTIASASGVAKETLRSQIKAVFRKTETNSQVELVRVGLRGLAAFRK